MQQHTHQPEPNSQTISLPAHLTTAAETRMDACIRRVLADRLSGQSRESQEELLQEARAQLHAMIAAHEEMGSTTEEALAAALQAFELEAAGVRPQEMRAGLTQGQRQALKIAFKCNLGATLLLMGILFATGDAINFGMNAYLIRDLYLTLPVLTGLGAGLLAPTRPVKSMLGAQLRLAPLTLALYAGWAALQATQHGYNPYQALAMVAALHTVSWVLVGSAAAGAGGLCRWAGQKITRQSSEKKLPV